MVRFPVGYEYLEVDLENMYTVNSQGRQNDAPNLGL